MTDERLVRSISGAFDELAGARTPDYLEVAIERASSGPQRPAWTYPGRWLPMDISTSAAPVPRLPWRQIGILALLAVLLTVSTAVYIGSRKQLPEAYGPAGNGLIAYAEATDIVVADSVTGQERTVVGGPEIDGNPRFSRDGSKIIFERLAPPPQPGSQVMVVAPDGSGLTALNPEPLELSYNVMAVPYTFAPDGKTVAIAAHHPDGGPGVLIAKADGSAAPRWLDLSSVAARIGSVREPAFRPTDGNLLLLTGDPVIVGAPPVVFTVDLTTGAITTVVQAVDGASLDAARWSPDGTSISYATWGSTGNSGLDVRTHIVAADGTGDHLLPAPPGMVFDIGGAWSNDGSKMLVVRGFSNSWDQTRAAIVPTDGSGPGVDVPYEGPIQGGCCYSWEWAPDDTKILGKRITPSEVPGQQVVIDVASATIKDAAWDSKDNPAWQRVAP